LHDGAAVVRDGRIVAASVVLPLSDNTAATSQLGTRHRAALGITEQSDAIAVVVSEETGQISVAENGRLIRNLDAERLDEALRGMLKLDVPDRERGSVLLGVGERIRLSARNAMTSNGSPSVNGPAKTPKGADAKPSRSA
jgi:hypothetical protein